MEMREIYTNEKKILQELFKSAFQGTKTGNAFTFLLNIAMYHKKGNSDNGTKILFSWKFTHSISIGKSYGYKTT